MNCRGLCVTNTHCLRFSRNRYLQIGHWLLTEISLSIPVFRSAQHSLHICHWAMAVCERVPSHIWWDGNPFSPARYPIILGISDDSEVSNRKKSKALPVDPNNVHSRKKFWLLGVNCISCFLQDQQYMVAVGKTLMFRTFSCTTLAGFSYRGEDRLIRSIYSFVDCWVYLVHFGWFGYFHEMAWVGFLDWAVSKVCPAVKTHLFWCDSNWNQLFEEVNPSFHRRGLLLVIGQ
jgi:hypothetical protein